MFTLLLCRHGQSLADLEPRRIEGSADFPLSDLGRRQADLLGHRIASEYSVDRILSSPLVRAHETAGKIAGILGLPVHVEKRLAERNSGLLAGMTHEQANRLYPVHHPIPVHHRPPEGESYLDQFCRVAEFYFETYYDPNSDGQTLLVVAHGGTINCLLDAALGLPAVSRVGFECGDTSLHELRIHPGGDLIIARLNCTSHLAGLA